MTAAGVLLTIYQTGSACIMRNGGLLYRGPAAGLTVDVRAAITMHRPVLLAVARASAGMRPWDDLPDLTGDDHAEAHALILAALGCPQSAHCYSDLISDAHRQAMVRGYLHIQQGDKGATG